MGSELTSGVGAAGEAAVASMFLSRGYDVYIPVFGSPSTDMIVDIDGKLLRLQVKTSNGSTSDLRYPVWKHSGDLYNDLVDWLALYSVYYGVAAFLKPEEAGVYPTMRYDTSEDSRHPTNQMRYARDFSIERVIKEALGKDE